jgi:hypothetical protein
MSNNQVFLISIKEEDIVALRNSINIILRDYKVKKCSFCSLLNVFSGALTIAFKGRSARRISVRF